MRNFVFPLLMAALMLAGVAHAQTPTTTTPAPARTPKLQAAPGTPTPHAAPSLSGGRPDVACRFPGPPNALGNFIRQNLQYPATAADKQVSGKVTVQFMVQADGSLTDFSVVGDTLGYGCEAEALRVARLMPSWVPAKRRNQPVPTTTLLTFPFGAAPALEDPMHRHQK
jgi:TonB family protein